MSFKEQTLEEFMESLSSKKAVPGGGGASAMAGALAASLANMVCMLTVGKKKYAEVEDQVKEASENLIILRDELISCMDEDAKAFEPLSKAYGLPRGTEAEAQIRNQVLEECLKAAAEPPMKICRLAAKTIPYIEFLAEKGSRLAVSDAGCAASFAMTAIQAGALNVRINTNMMTERELACEMEKELDEIIRTFIPRCENIYQSVFSGK